jgi:signal transduction histidine kinase
MTLFKQFAAAVTGSDLLPQVRKTRRRLQVFVSASLLIFLALQAFVTNVGVNVILGGTGIVRRPFDNPDLTADVQTSVAMILFGSALLTWIFLSFVAWLVLYRNLKPVSQSIKDRDQFINNARHELRTPLTVLSSEVELFQAHSLSEQAKLDLKDISQQVTRLKNLTQSLLTTLDGSKSIQTEFNLIANIKRIENELMHIYAEKNIVLEMRQQEVNSIRTNEVLFNQLLFNVLENAYKHGKPNSNIEVSISKNPTIIAISNTVSSETIPNSNGVGVQASESIATTLGISMTRSIKITTYSVDLHID